MEYMIGCNYWDSKSGTEMWRNWDEDSVDKDLEVLKKYGSEYLRVFPNWRDFQPIHPQIGWMGVTREYTMADGTPTDEFGLDYTMIKRFRKFCDIAAKHGIKLIVSILTGWMSGKLFVPPALVGKNIINDSEALMWEIKFVRGFVKNLKDKKEIVYWDIGNECNNLAHCSSRYEAWLWTASIRNAILCEDNTRRIMSGMHLIGVSSGENCWTMADQGELTDMMCPHPYPSPSVGGDVDPINCLRTSLIPTVQAVLYSGIGGKPAVVQESGGFTDMLGDKETAAQWIRVNLLSCWANGTAGYLWWCAHEQILLDYPPYSWSMLERELGILYTDRTPKPVALEMQKVSKMLKDLPFETLPEREVDAVCVIPDIADAKELYHIATSAYVLSKQAKIEIIFRHYKQELPDTKAYIVPSISGWAPIDKRVLDTLKKRASEGAAVYISINSGIISEFEKLTGLKSKGMIEDNDIHICKFGDDALPFRYGKKFKTMSIGAKVIAEDSDGTVVFSKNPYGKGSVFFLNFPLEEMIWKIPNVFNDMTSPYYKIYAEVAKGLINKKIVLSDNPNIGITIHRLDYSNYIAVAVNYSDKAQNPGLTIKGKYNLLYGDTKMIAGCDAAILKVEV